MKKKGDFDKVAFISVIFVLILSLGYVLFIGPPAGFPRDGNYTCYNDLDCGQSNITWYCGNNGSSCLYTEYHQCILPGTPEAYCMGSGGGGCAPCPAGCYLGHCLNDTNYSDLIVRNITFDTNESGVLLAFPVIVNTGTRMAPPSTVRVFVAGAEYFIPIGVVFPQEAVEARPPVRLALAQGIRYSFFVTADVFNDVSESNEGNNNFADHYDVR
ncbi:MAG: CARDB domain-containing protein [archaeon]